MHVAEKAECALRKCVWLKKAKLHNPPRLQCLLSSLALSSVSDLPVVIAMPFNRGYVLLIGSEASMEAGDGAVEDAFRASV